MMQGDASSQLVAALGALAAALTPLANQTAGDALAAASGQLAVALAAADALLGGGQQHPSAMQQLPAPSAAITTAAISAAATPQHAKQAGPWAAAVAPGPGAGAMLTAGVAGLADAAASAASAAVAGSAGSGLPVADAVAAAAAAAADAAADAAPGAPGWVGLLLAGAPLLAVGLAVSLGMDLRLHGRLTAATLRCALQLLLLALLLSVVFSYATWWLVLLYGTGMVVVAAIETVSRPAYTYKGMLTHVLGSLGLSCSAIMAYAIALVLPSSSSDPWWLPAKFVTILGMTLAGGVYGVGIGLSAVLAEVAGDGGRAAEFALAMGASRLEAAWPIIQAGIAAGLAPMVDVMQVTGIVAIPELMMGQLLGGVSTPLEAATYQAVVLFLSAASTTIALSLAVVAATLRLVDSRLCLRSDALAFRDNRAAGIEPWVAAQLHKAVHAARDGTRRTAARCQLTFGRLGALRRGGGPWRSPRAGISLFTRGGGGSGGGGRRKFKRSSTRESMDFVDGESSFGSRLQDVILSDEEGYLEEGGLPGGANPEGAVEQPLLPTSAHMSSSGGGHSRRMSRIG